MMPAARSVWRKGNEERHVLFVDDSFVSFVRFVDAGWGCIPEKDWHAWAADAVQVWPTPAGETVRLTDAEIDRVAERLREKVFPTSVTELRVGNVSELAAMFDPPQLPQTITATVEPPQ
jgi:hypothetical protein